jgi:hypothetical protein
MISLIERKSNRREDRLYKRHREKEGGKGRSELLTRTEHNTACAVVKVRQDKTNKVDQDETLSSPSLSTTALSQAKLSAEWCKGPAGVRPDTDGHFTTPP